MYISANMANLQKCSRCKSEIDISYFGLNRKKQPYKTCVNCRSKKSSGKPLITTDNENFDNIDIKINTFAKLLVHLDINRPRNDDVLNDPTKACELMYISNKRVEILKQIRKLDTDTQMKVDLRYRELVAEYDNSLMHIRILHLSGNEFLSTQIQKTTTINDLIQTIFNQKQKHYTQYTLLFEGKELSVNDHKEMLTSYGIKNESLLNIIIHDERNAEYVTTTDANGGVTTKLNIIDDDTDLLALFRGLKIVAF